MAVHESKEKTKDGRKWFFKAYYTDLSGNQKQFKSKKFITKKQAQDEERLFFINIKGIINKNMTFEELYNDFHYFQEQRIKITTLVGYEKSWRQLQSLANVKLNDFTVNHYNKWKMDIHKKKCTTGYKNSLYKFLKTLLNYAIKYHNFNFADTIFKMEGFTNPNELKKEMLFFDYEEFKKFIAVELDITYKTFFKMLYYCGLRLGEAKALTWKDIDFENKQVTINKNLISKIKGQRYIISTPKTKSSIRTLPIPKNLLNELKILYQYSKSFYKFNDKYFVFGGAFPLADTTIKVRKNKNCKLAKVKQIRVHDFRHSCASLLINNNANIVLVAKYLGHSKIDMTLNIYSHLYKNQMSDIVLLIDQM